MKYSQVATLLNETEIPNLLGEGSTIADDLNNIVDVGVAMENLTADQIKDYTGSFVAGIVRLWLDERVFNKTVNRLYRDYYEFGAIVQRVKSGLMEVTDDVSTNLENGTVYQQDKFIGFNFDNKIYTKQTGFELDWSVPNNMWKVAFSSPMELMKLIAYIGNRAEATVRANIFALQLATVRKMAVTHAATRIKLVTLYNSIFNAGEGDTPITAAEAEGKEDFPFTMGQNQFDFIDYEDFCEQVAMSVGQDDILGVINICSGYPEKLADRVERFIEENCYKIKLKYGAFPDRPYDSKAVWGDGQKIDSIMNKQVKN